MKTIKVYYEDVAEKIENSIMKVAIDYPDFKYCRYMYLYELYYFDFIKQQMKDDYESYLEYDLTTFEFLPFFLRIDDVTYQDLCCYLESDYTEYEETKWNDEMSLLNAIMSIYRNDVNMWKTD